MKSKKARTPPSVSRTFDLLTERKDLPPGIPPRATPTMSAGQFVAAMLIDMGINTVDMDRDLDLTGQDYNDAMINVSDV